MLLTRDPVFITLATMWCLVQNSEGSSCPDGYGLNYTLPIFENCKVKVINGTEVQLIPKLIPRRFAAKNCYGRQHDGIPPGYRVCRIPDCLKKPCQNGWCQEEMTNYSCHCLPDFTGINCESKIPITEVPETMLPPFSRKSENLTTVAASSQVNNATKMTENLTTVEASTQLKNVTGITDLGTTPAAFTPTFTKRDEQTGIPTAEALLSTSSSRQETSDCSLNPCHNGGLCTETPEGYQCSCTTNFHGRTCSCPIVHTPDVGDTRKYTFRGLHIAPDMTSFDFEVSANNDVHIGLSRSDAQEEYMYEIAIGAWENTGGGIRRCVYQWGPCDFETLRQEDPEAMGLSRIPSYDHYQISFADGNIILRRYDSQELLMEYHDPNPLEVNYVGIWTGYGSEGYWKFLSFCS